ELFPKRGGFASLSAQPAFCTGGCGPPPPPPAPPAPFGAAFPPPPPPLPADGGGPAAKAAGQLDAEDAGAAALICGDLVRCWAGCLVEVAFLRRCKLRAVQDEQFDLAQIAKSQEPEA
ncbi:unnamed protein product, partial [Prorocentrum cordatum]